MFIKLNVCFLVFVVGTCQAFQILKDMKKARDDSLARLTKQAQVYSCMVADLKTLRKESTLSCAGKLMPSIMKNVAKDCFGDTNFSLMDKAEIFCKADQFGISSVLEQATCVTQRLTQMQFNEITLAANGVNKKFDIKSFLEDVNECYSNMQQEQNFTDK